ncbi:MAG TPA: hypothetical protein VMM84_11295 [Pyrinomonadaceae bacterium]|nr:hypothetical protein [Pyrinomonadaceae bacterium]
MAKGSTTKKAGKTQLRPLFDSIRKPSAPPGHPLGGAKPADKARPAGRKAKHKRRPEEAFEQESTD